MIERAIDFIKAQDHDSYKCLQMIQLKSSYLKLALFINLEKNIGRSLENPPKIQKLLEDKGHLLCELLLLLLLLLLNYYYYKRKFTELKIKLRNK